MCSVLLSTTIIVMITMVKMSWTHAAMPSESATTSTRNKTILSVRDTLERFSTAFRWNGKRQLALSRFTQWREPSCISFAWAHVIVDLKTPLYDLQRIVLVPFLPAINFYSERKSEGDLTYTANAKQVSFTKKRRSATGKREKNGGKNKVTRC